MAKKVTRSEVSRAFGMPMRQLESGVRTAYVDFLAEHARSKAQIDRFKSSKDTKTTKRVFSRLLSANREAAHKLICSKLKYCENVEAHGVKMALEVANAVVTGKIMAITTLPIPAVKIAVWMIRSRMLDPFCDCKKPAKSIK
jgi:hypothetical protein